MNQPSVLDWVPLKSVGAIPLGTAAGREVDRLGLRRLAPDAKRVDWETYELPGSDVRIYAEKSQISTVGCFTNLTYQSTSVIGLGEREIVKLFGEPIEKELEGA